MKIGIMTWHQYYNYGTALQLFAMSKILEILGHEPLVINYHTRRIGKNLGYGSLQKKIINRTRQYLWKTNETIDRTDKFIEFINDGVSFTDECDTLPELERLNELFDAFICGSDQIWAPSVFDPHYFLDFVDEKKKTIAYAPSLGLPVIKDTFIESKIKEYAGQIAHVSTRECSGSKIITNLTGREVKTVLDPTLLLKTSDWNKVINNSRDVGKLKYSKPYVLVYMLGVNVKHWRWIYRICQELNLDIKIVPTFLNDFKRKGCIRETIGPVEFLGAVKDASFVCTDSYHGTLFAIQYCKDFITFKRFKDSDDNNQNSRIYNILKELHLKDRIFDRLTVLHVIRQHVDYDRVNDKLSILREQSLAYLKEALNDVKKYNAVKKEKKNNVKRNLNICCGCGACKQVCEFDAIQMKVDDEGFISSFVDELLCKSCGKCREVCPNISGINGMVVSDGTIYSYKDYSNDVLMKSSSGGAAYAISMAAVSDGYSVVGCEYSKKTNSARHIVVDNIEELYRLQGSKYIQSDFSAVLSEIKKAKKSIIFGTPCQIAAARLLFKDQDVLYVDLICHGVPSIYLYSSYLWYLSSRYMMDGNQLSTVFRYKPKGWRQRYILNTDGKREICEHQNKDPFFLMFEHSICYSKNCYECPWRNKSYADIRIGDYWGPRFKRDKTGVSMIISLTDEGKKIIDSFGLNDRGKLEKTDIRDYLEYQQIYNMHAPVFREEIIRQLRDNVGINEIVNEYIKPLERERRIIILFKSIKESLKVLNHEEQV